MKKLNDELVNIEQNKYAKYIFLSTMSYLFSMLTYFNEAFFNKQIDFYNVYFVYASTFIYSSLNYFLRKNEPKSKTYDEIKIMYDEYVKLISNFMKNLDIDLDKDKLKAYKFLCLLYKTGFVSYNCSYKYDSNKRYKDIVSRGIMGSEIVTGNGVCRHISYFIHDVLEELGFENDIVNINSLKINKDTLKFEKQSIIQKIYGNHTIIGMNVDNKYLLLDPTNFSKYYKSNNIKHYDLYKKHDMSNKKSYKFSDDTIVIDDYNVIGIIKQILRTCNNTYEKFINIDNVIEDLRRIPTKEEVKDIDISIDYLINYKKILEFYRSNSNFFSELNDKIYSLIKI